MNYSNYPEVSERVNFKNLEWKIKNILYKEAIQAMRVTLETALRNTYESWGCKSIPNHSIAAMLGDPRIKRFYGEEMIKVMQEMRVMGNKTSHPNDRYFTEQKANELFEGTLKMYAKLHGIKPRAYEYIKSKTDAEEVKEKMTESLSAKEKELAEARAAVGKFQAKAEKLEEEVKKPKHNVRVGFKVNW